MSPKFQPKSFLAHLEAIPSNPITSYLYAAVSTVLQYHATCSDAFVSGKKK